MAKKTKGSHRIDMKKKLQSGKNDFWMTRNDEKCAKMNKICTRINGNLVKSYQNIKNIANLPTKFLCDFFELDRNKIYWVHLRNAISSKMQ